MEDHNFYLEETDKNNGRVLQHAYANTREGQRFGHVIRSIWRAKGWGEYASRSVFEDYDYIWRATLVHEFVDGVPFRMWQFHVPDGEVLEINMQRKWIDSSF